MIDRQLELGLDRNGNPSNAQALPVRRARNLVPARWWFDRIQATITRAMAAGSPPPPRPEQRHLDLAFGRPITVDFRRSEVTDLPEAA